MTWIGPRPGASRQISSRPPAKLAAEGYHLYEQFRPSVPAGTRGWGAKGTLDLEAIGKLAAHGSR
jgi:hypothetical protein